MPAVVAVAVRVAVDLDPVLVVVVAVAGIFAAPVMDVDMVQRHKRHPMLVDSLDTLDGHNSWE